MKSPLGNFWSWTNSGFDVQGKRSRSGKLAAGLLASGLAVSIGAQGLFATGGAAMAREWQEVVAAGVADTQDRVVADEVPVVADDELPPNGAPSSIPLAQQDMKLRFAFNNAKWETVIDWFAEQLDLIVYTRYSGYPTGTFTNVDGKDYSVKDALDQLNLMLTLEGYTLVRYSNYLIVINHAQDGIPADLIPMVAEEELDDRGKYELVSCRFSISGLDLEYIERQVRQMVKEPRGNVTLLSVSEELVVRENAEQLRLIRGMLNQARTNANIVYKRVALEHIPFPALMQIVRAQFGMRENENRLNDGTLVISTVNTETQPWISGTPDKVDRVLKLIKTLDVEENRPLGVEIEGYVLKYYMPRTDPQIVHRILIDFFTGRSDIKMTLSPDSDIIYVKAKPRDHVEIENVIGNVESNALVFEEIPCHRLIPSEMVLKLKTALGMSPSILDEDANRNKQNIIFMEEYDSVFVRGTKRIVDDLKLIAAKLDPPPTDGPGQKSNYRILPIDPNSLDDVLDLFEGVWEISGRPTEIQLKLPKDRRPSMDGGASSGGQRRSPFRFPSFDRQYGEGSFGNLNPESLTPDQMNQLIQRMQEIQQESEQRSNMERERSGSAQPTSSDERPRDPQRTQPANPVQTRRSLSGRDYQVVGLGQRQRIRETTGLEDARPQSRERHEAAADQMLYASARVAAGRQDPDNDDLPPVRTQRSDLPNDSVPGDPLIIEMTPNGLMLRSRDLDALDLAEKLLRDLSKESVMPLSTEPAKTVFFLGYRPASEVASEIEEILGVGGGGGGGGGMGDLIGNMAQNALGGAAGGMLGAMMGGGGGGSSSSPKTTGEVSIHVDNYLNAMIVYANIADTDEIEYLIDLKDRPTAPHDPRIYGMARSIKIKYRDPQVIKEQVDVHFAPYLRKPEGQGGGQQQQQPNPEALLRAMMGGRGGRGGGGGGGGSAEAAKPQISVSVDVEAKLLLVKGPDYLVEDVEKFVREMDYPDAVEKKVYKVLPLPPGVTADQVTRVMQDLYSAGTQTAQQRPGQQPGQQQRGGQQGGAQFGGGGNADAIRALQGMMGGGGGGNRAGAAGGANFGGGNRGGVGGAGGGNFGGGGGNRGGGRGGAGGGGGRGR